MPTSRRQRTAFAERLCAVVATPSAAQAMRQLRQARRFTHTIELRLDWLRSDHERGKFIAALRRSARKGLTFISI